ncbi:hypothetical protein EYF80_035268 [Liparis tanakae]|uniref:Uncharacterized protein n=1 Tax=Liparis tanakae TaxID=230148 RepID=A0A4Z2GNV4_9TELE|nr:hypothetical protein EYF80_035268 [Liparis tanakae]
MTLSGMEASENALTAIEPKKNKNQRQTPVILQTHGEAAAQITAPDETGAACSDIIEFHSVVV